MNNKANPNLMNNEAVTHYVLSECERRGRKLNCQVSSLLQDNALYQSPANKTKRRNYPILPVIRDENSKILYYDRSRVVEWTERLIDKKSKQTKPKGQ